MRTTIKFERRSLKSAAAAIFAAVALTMAGCAAGEQQLEIPGDEATTFTLELPAPKTVATRADGTATENNITSLTLLLCDPVSAGGKLVKKITPTFTAVSSTDNAQWTIKAKIPYRAEAYDLLFVANASCAELEEDEDTQATIQSSLKASINPGTAWSTSTAIPMFGQLPGQPITDDTYSPTGTISLRRMMARVNVSVSSANSLRTKFTLTSVSVYNYATDGYVVPTTAAIADQTNSTTSLTGTSDETTTPINYTTGASPGTYEYKNQIYVFENAAGAVYPTTDWTLAPCIIVGGTFNGTPGFYRLDFVNNSTALDIVRNHSYNFTITDVKGTGYTSAADARNNPPANISFTVDPWSDEELDGIDVDGTPHSITTATSADGKIVARHTQALAQMTIEVAAVPSEGKAFKSWTTTPAGLIATADLEKNPATFTMPDQNVTVSATWEDAAPGAYLMLVPGTDQSWTYDNITSREIKVASDLEWEVAISNEVGGTNAFTWESVIGDDGGAIGTFEVRPSVVNATVIPRTATITVSNDDGSRSFNVSQTGAPAKITLSTPSPTGNYPVGGGSKSFTVTSNIPWTPGVIGTGFSVSGATGNTTPDTNGLFNGSFTVTADNYTGQTARTGSVSVKGSGTYNEVDYSATVSSTVSVTQVGGFSVSPTSLTGFTYNDGVARTVTVNVSEGVAWSVSGANLIFSSSNGIGPGTFTVRPNTNSAVNSRTLTATVTSEGVNIPITITQGGRGAYIALLAGTDMLSVPYLSSSASSSGTRKVNSNVTWTVTVEPSAYFSVSGSVTTAPGQAVETVVTVTTKTVNNTGSDRIGTVTITDTSGSGLPSESFKVIQAGNPLASRNTDDILYINGNGKLAVGKWTPSGPVTFDNMVFAKFGSIIGVSATTATDSYSSSDVLFNPTDLTANNWGYASTVDLPCYDDADWNAGLINISNRTNYHTLANIKAGKGDICQLVGYSADQIKGASSLPTNIGGYRLPTVAENFAFYGDNATFQANATPVATNTFPNSTPANAVLPAAGDRSYSGGKVQFRNNFGYYWSSTASSPGMANGMEFRSSFISVRISISFANSGYAVRCVKQ